MKRTIFLAVICILFCIFNSTYAQEKDALLRQGFEGLSSDLSSVAWRAKEEALAKEDVTEWTKPLREMSADNPPKPVRGFSFKSKGRRRIHTGTTDFDRRVCSIQETVF